MEKYPSWLKGLPWKGSRSLIAARGFKSLLLREKRGLEEASFFTEKRGFPERRVRRGQKHRSAASGGRSEVLL